MSLLDDPRLRLPLALVAALLLHTSVLARIRVFGVMPDFMLLVAVAAGISGGPIRGATMGFAAGLAIDLFLTTPLGLSALVFTFVGYGVGVANAGVLRAAWYIPLLTAGAASSAGVFLFALAASVLGAQMFGAHLITISAVVGVSNTVLAPVAVRLVGWAMGSTPAGVPTPV